MLMRIRDGGRISTGCCFYRYFPKLNYAFDKGEVKTCSDGIVEVDFGDTMVRFFLHEIAYMINTDSMEEHYMSLETGVVVEDYQSNPPMTGAHDDPVLTSFEELLKRI